jgi:glycosyltransferase involved in cell wall biosynthesis
VLVQRTQVQDTGLAERIIDSCRKRGACLVFEIDDDLFDIPAQHPEHDMYARVTRAAKMIATSADSVITSTETLRKKMLRYNAHSIVLPNYIDERLWKEPSALCVPANGVWRILYAGTRSHGPDLEFLGKAVRRLNSSIRKRIQIDVVGVSNGASCDWYTGFPVPHQCASSYPAFVRWIQNQRRWHWGVAPLLDTEFNRSKSALKFLEYAALGLPALCSDMPVYSEAVRSEETGLLVANDMPSWCEALERAATNPKLWTQLRGRCTSVVQANTIAANAETIKSLWQSIAARQEPIEREREAADEFEESGKGRRRD